jgi:hypothetical protein
LNSPPLSLSFIPIPPIPGIISTGLIFSFSYLRTQFFHHTHPCSAFPYVLPPLTGTNLQTGPILLYSPLLLKRDIVLFKITIHGGSLWHFNEYVYYSMNWFIPSIFLLLHYSPSMMISTSLKILYSFLCRKYINHIHFFISFFYSPPPVSALP